VEKIEACSGVISWLLKGQVEQATVNSLLGVEAGMSLELEALCELVLDFELGTENVGRRPGVGEDSPVFIVRVFRLQVASDVSVLRVASSSNTECDIGGRLGL
jgi:hypothetical protein